MNVLRPAARCALALMVWLSSSPALARSQASAALAPVAQLLRVCVSEEPHPPWRLAGPDGRVVQQGLDFAFLDELRQRTGIQLEVALRPGGRCLRELAAGDQDAMFAISHLPEREGQARFPGLPGRPDTERAVRRIEYAWYVPQNSPLHWDGETLHGLLPTDRVGVQRGYAITARLRAKQMRFEEGPSSVQRNLDMLQRGRVAALALHGQAAEAVLAQRPDLRRTLRRLSPALELRPYYLVFSHRFMETHESLALQLWQAAAAVRDSEHLRLQDPHTWRVFGHSGR
ncbi:substrate-binding periplasmic protein [Inhella gelatinilytica]|uniref:ABC transporter substrate-binding protein n=1 Tax=Inhella gelatinilytica TaxID=2795030 RepID=A0A931NEX9_9BURK|nr:ABC transporter substrate-binding protein [Inhella gelatinilytica]MBH9553685.1 ABC transporter substrate-binding protein [Inhella gelatinilytica]